MHVWICTSHLSDTDRLKSSSVPGVTACGCLVLKLMLYHLAQVCCVCICPHSSYLQSHSWSRVLQHIWTLGATAGPPCWSAASGSAPRLMAHHTPSCNVQTCSSLSGSFPSCDQGMSVENAAGKCGGRVSDRSLKGFFSCRASLRDSFPYRQIDKETQRICFHHLHDSWTRSEGLCRNGWAGVPGTVTWVSHAISLPGKGGY